MNDSTSSISIRFLGPTPIRSWFLRWGLIVAEFGAVQVAVQVFTALAGLLIVRSLAKPEYALFAIANSMQMTCNLLAERGLGIGLRSIGGQLCNDRRRFGELLSTALGLRRRFAFMSFVICLPLTAWMLWRNGAAPLQTIGLCLALVLGCLGGLGCSVWNVSPQLHGEYRRLQNLDLGNSALRLTLLSALALTRLSALLAALVGVAGNWFQAFYLRRWAQERAELSLAPTLDHQRALGSLSARWLPNVIFFSLQGQLTLLIITVFGSVDQVANMTALGRLAILLTVVSQVYSQVLTPRFTRCQESARLRRLYLTLVGATAVGLLPLVGAAWIYPEPLLWLLGESYRELGQECGWVIAAAYVGQIASVMWSLNSSKAWIRIQSFAFIPAIVTAQAAAAMLLDLRQFHDLLIFNFVSAAAPLPAYMIDALLGLKILARKAASH